MIRVVRPGTKIVIVDETEKVVQDIYEKTPTLVQHLPRKRKIEAPPRLVSPWEIGVFGREMVHLPRAEALTTVLSKSVGRAFALS